MASMNTAMIRGYLQQNYPGLPTDDTFVQNIMNASGGGDSGQIDQAIRASSQYQQQQQTNAQNLYNAQQGSAISTLQTGKTNLSGQYADLLKSVTGVYQPLIDQATMMQNNQNASRGLVSNAGTGGQGMISALNPVYSAEASNQQQIGQGSIADINAYNNAISALQSGQATTNLGIPLNFGSLQMNQQALPSQIALAQAQGKLAGAQAQAAPFINMGIPGITFNAGNNTASFLGQSFSQAALQDALSKLL